MRWSQLHVPTLREDPADADAASHRLLVRAGFTRQLAPGHWSLLPLAVRVRAKVMDVIREELGRIGGQEVLLPALPPAGLWRRSGTPAPAGSEALTPRDRRGAELALGAANEAAVAVEANHDEHGIVWPRRIAPFTVAVVALDPADADVAKAADELRDRLAAAGVDVVVDDRELRPGVKFRDCELVGIPYRVTIGPRDLANGTVELAERATGARRPLPVGTAADRVLALLSGPEARFLG